jgi:hypothetical protein
MRPSANVVKLLIAIIAIMIWFENLGFKATTLIAGLGIGGLAVALAKIEEWRGRDELCLPGFPDERIAKLRNTLAYPPEGSAKPPEGKS